jgi:hypothetical protein
LKWNSTTRWCDQQPDRKAMYILASDLLLVVATTLFDRVLVQRE